MALQSEYRQKYCDDFDGSGKENYKEMLNFRNKRKSCELRHTPLIWLDQEGNINDESLSDNEIDIKQNLNSTMIVEEQSIPLYQCKSI